MAKYYGKIGYAKQLEVHPGVYEDAITEHDCYGDIIRNTRRYDAPNAVNTDITINNQISIIGDPFTFENVYGMRYITFMGAKWRISSVDVEYPRITIHLGGLYNDENTRVAPG